MWAPPCRAVRSLLALLPADLGDLRLVLRQEAQVGRVRGGHPLQAADRLRPAPQAIASWGLCGSSVTTLGLRWSYSGNGAGTRSIRTVPSGIARVTTSPSWG